MSIYIVHYIIGNESPNCIFTVSKNKLINNIIPQLIEQYILYILSGRMELTVFVSKNYKTVETIEILNKTEICIKNELFTQVIKFDENQLPIPRCVLPKTQAIKPEQIRLYVNNGTIDDVFVYLRRLFWLIDLGIEIDTIDMSIDLSQLNISELELPYWNRPTINIRFNHNLDMWTDLEIDEDTIIDIKNSGDTKIDNIKIDDNVRSFLLNSNDIKRSGSAPSIEDIQN